MVAGPTVTAKELREATKGTSYRRQKGGVAGWLLDLRQGEGEIGWVMSLWRERREEERKWDLVAKAGVEDILLGVGHAGV